MRRIIERIEPRPCGRGEELVVDATARDIMGDDIMGDPYTFEVRGNENIAAIYAEAGQ